MNKNRVKYVVLPERREVKAIIDDCAFDAIQMINNRFLPTITDGLMITTLYDTKNKEKFLMRDTYTAVAHCHPDDEFNIEIGKKVAYEKLCDKYHDSLNRHLDHIAYRLARGAFAISDYLIEREG